MERNNPIKKGLVVAVILLFFSVSVIPSTGNIVSFDDDTTPPVTTCTLDPLQNQMAITAGMSAMLL